MTREPVGGDRAADLVARFIPSKSAARGLQFAVRMLLKVSNRPNPAIAAMDDPAMLLTLIVGKKQPPFRFDRADYMRCLDDHGPEKLGETLRKRCDEFFGNSALMNAAMNDNEDYAIALAIKHAQLGISPDIPDHAGKTPLMVATVKAQDDLAHCLLETGADPTLLDGAGRNLLHHACMRGNTGVFSAAIEHMSPEERTTALAHRDERGMTPRDLLAAVHDEDLLHAKQVAEDGSGLELTGRLEAEFSMWPGRLETDSCDMDRGGGQAGSARTLGEAIVAHRRALESRFDELVGGAG